MNVGVILRWSSNFHIKFLTFFPITQVWYYYFLNVLFKLIKTDIDYWNKFHGNKKLMLSVWENPLNYL